MSEDLNLNEEEVQIDSNSESTEEQNPILILENQLQQSNDKYIRLVAEFDNYKKRVQKEKEEIAANTKVKMLQAILDVDNDIYFALKSVKEDSGVHLLAQKIENFLKTQGIEAIQTETYDEDLHEVISVLEIGESKIIDIASKGYTLNGKPFRYPKIVLGK
jgi:molecular chaperone GrpE